MNFAAAPFVIAYTMFRTLRSGSLFIFPALLLLSLTGSAVDQPRSLGRSCDGPSDLFVLVEGGTFLMGDVLEDGSHAAPEEPVHEVRIDDFYLCRFEVTVGEFRAFVEATGCRTSAETDNEVKATEEMLEKGQMPYPNWKEHWFKQGDDHPVIWIAWEDAVAYCNWRSREAGLPPAYSETTRRLVDRDGEEVDDIRKVEGFRLPTEAEWEFAARERGRRVRFGNGQDMARSSEINFNASSGSYPYLEKGINRETTTPVGSFAQNRLGLHDMSGNAWEWCTDTGAPYSTHPKVNPCNQAGTNHIIRGGTYQSEARACRAAARLDWWPFAKCAASGFRLALTAGTRAPVN
jgi:formylglycine-generating enzyme required for sulfatase activity